MKPAMRDSLSVKSFPFRLTEMWQIHEAWVTLSRWRVLVRLTEIWQICEACMTLSRWRVSVGLTEIWPIDKVCTSIFSYQSVLLPTIHKTDITVVSGAAEVVDPWKKFQIMSTVINDHIASTFVISEVQRKELHIPSCAGTAVIINTLQRLRREK